MIEAAGPLRGSVRAVALAWGEEGFRGSQLAEEPPETYDVILASELYYDESVFEYLLWTYRHFLRPASAGAPGNCVYSIFLNRPFSMMFLALLHDTGAFEVELVPDKDFDTCGLE